MADVGIKELLEAGVHFGHQTRRWNPKMRRFIFGERGGIYIIDLLKTAQLLEQAQRFATEVSRRGGTVLFVGTKKQARDGIKEIATAAGMPYVNHRWLGGLLTNYQTMSLRIRRLHDLERYAQEGQLALLPTRERLSAEADLEKLRANLGGVKDMQRVPDAMFVIDLKTEAIAVREAQRLRIPIIGLVDTNCDPDGIDYVIPGNDDAIRACNLITHAIGDVVQQGRSTFRAEEEQARREAEEQQRRDQEERARREAEERAAAEAAERAAAEEALSQAGEGEPRDVAEAQVAEAVQTGAGREVEGRRQAEATAAAQATDEIAAPAAGSPGPGHAEQVEDPRTHADRPTPGDTGADIAAAEEGAQRSRQRARGAKAAEAPAAPEPGPSPVAEAAEEAAPPLEVVEPATPAAAKEAEAPAPAARRAEGSSGDEASGRGSKGAAKQADVAPAAAKEADVAPAAAKEADAAPAAAKKAAAKKPAAKKAAKKAAAQDGPPPGTTGAEVHGTDAAPIEAPADEDKGVVETAVDAAQSVAETAAGITESAAEAVAERAPGPLKGVAKAVAGAAGAVEDAVSDDDNDKKDEDK
jgi:small subunit ribosomal protein S2